jgi:hypothetical protein
MIDGSAPLFLAVEGSRTHGPRRFGHALGRKPGRSSLPRQPTKRVAVQTLFCGWVPARSSPPNRCRIDSPCVGDPPDGPHAPN